jgi:threonine dehydrogenase-like Zn-dependent dehydrogenase
LICSAQRLPGFLSAIRKRPLVQTWHRLLSVFRVAPVIGFELPKIPFKVNVLVKGVKNMRAAVTTGKRREIIVKEVPQPVIEPGSVLLRVKCCSICGTDLEYLDNSLSYRKGGALRAGAILGHEYCGEVIEIGEGVEGWLIGDRATMERSIGCGSCYFCRRYMPTLCLGKGNERAIYTELTPEGYGSSRGALAEYILRRPESLLKIPDCVTDEEAALVEPLNVGACGVVASEITVGDTAAIIGAGKIGLGTMLAAKAAGAAPTIMIDIHDARLEKAKEMGAELTLNATEVDVVPEVVKATEAGPDVVFICVRDGNVFLQAIDMVRRGGKIVILGQIPPVEVNPGYWLVKSLRIEAVFSGQLLSMTDSLNLIARKQVDVTPMISEVLPLDQIQTAFNKIWSGENIVSIVTP